MCEVWSDNCEGGSRQGFQGKVSTCLEGLHWDSVTVIVASKDFSACIRGSLNFGIGSHN